MEKNYPFLQNQQVGETVRELGLAGQNEKYANHGGLIIIFATWCLCCLQVAKYLRSAFDRNHFVDGNNRFYR
jgi:hypothetical protein